MIIIFPCNSLILIRWIVVLPAPLCSPKSRIATVFFWPDFLQSVCKYCNPEHRRTLPHYNNAYSSRYYPSFRCFQHTLDTIQVAAVTLQLFKSSHQIGIDINQIRQIITHQNQRITLIVKDDVLAILITIEASLEICSTFHDYFNFLKSTHSLLID